MIIRNPPRRLTKAAHELATLVCDNFFEGHLLRRHQHRARAKPQQADGKAMAKSALLDLSRTSRTKRHDIPSALGDAFG
jgi:hypothetical protein